MEWWRPPVTGSKIVCRRSEEVMYRRRDARMITDRGVDCMPADKGRNQHCRHANTEHCEVELLSPPMIQPPDDAGRPRRLVTGCRYSSWWGYMVVEAPVLVVGDHEERALEEILVPA